MPSGSTDTTEIGLRVEQIRPSTLDARIEERIEASPYIKALVSALTEFIPGFEPLLRAYLTQQDHHH